MRRIQHYCVLQPRLDIETSIVIQLWRGRPVPVVTVKALPLVINELGWHWPESVTQETQLCRSQR